MSRSRYFVVPAVLSLVLAVRSASGGVITEDFSSNPIAPAGSWSFGVGDNSHSQFTWNAAAPAAYTGDPVGSLGVHLDSSLPTVRLQRPLGATYSDGNSFEVKSRFSFTVTSAATDTALQMAFGLVNSSLTGGDRTGSFANFFSDDFFHTIEFNYFPQHSTFNPSLPGPTLAPAVAGAQAGSSDAFSNFQSVFGAGSDLGGNTGGQITTLPASTVLEATLDYQAGTKTLSLLMNQVNPDGSLTALDTGIPPVVLGPGGLPFAVDSLAIMAYHDGFGDSQNPSLVADMTFEQLQFVDLDSVPEPSTLALVALSGWLLACGLRRTT